MHGDRGVTLVELLTVLSILALGLGTATPLLGRLLPVLRVHGAAADLHAALHLTRARARATGVPHALALAPDGRSFRIVEDPGVEERTIAGPTPLGGDVVATSNITIGFSPKGFAVPFGTITIRSEGAFRRLVVNLLGRVRVESGEPAG